MATPNIAPEDALQPAYTPPTPPVATPATPVAPVAPATPPAPTLAPGTVLAANGQIVTEAQVRALQGESWQRAEKLGITQEQARRLMGWGDVQQSSFNQRSSLSTSGTATQAISYFDNSKGVEVWAPAGKHFELYSGGGVKLVDGEPTSAGSTNSDLFTQNWVEKDGKKVPVSGISQDKLGVTPIAGKTIESMGSYFDTARGIDVKPEAGYVYIKYTDGTVEKRAENALNTPGTAQSASSFGKTAAELGITNDTEIKNADGSIRVKPTGDAMAYGALIYKGQTYRANNGETRVARPGYAYYQDPTTGNIVERPDTGSENALPSNTPLKTKKTPQDEIATIDSAGNASQQADLDKILKATNGKVDLSSSSSLLASVTSMLSKKTETPSLLQIYADQKKTLGVDQLETNLAQKDAEIAKLDAEWNATQEANDAMTGSVFEINRRTTEQQRTYNKMRGLMVAERDGIATQLNNKNSVLNTMVTLAGQDYQNAKAAYDTQFSQAVQIMQLLGQEQDKQQTNARANLQIVTNLIQSGNIKYDSMSATQKAEITSMETQAGLPSGFTSFVSKTVKDPVVSFMTAYEDASGNRIQPVGTIKADGTFSITNINQGKVDKPKSTGSGTSSSTSSNAEAKENAAFDKDVASWIAKLDAKTAYKVDWRTAWDALHAKYPKASTETIDYALGLQRRNN